MLDILSWNIQQGGGTRVRKIIDALRQQQATIIVLSEFKNNDKGELIRQELLKHGYRFQAVTAAAKKENSVLIASKIACHTILHPNSDPVFGHNIVEIQTKAFHLMGVYLPHKKKHVLFDYIQELIKESPVPYIITGDFNSGINEIDQKGTSFWYQEAMHRFPTLNYQDAFRHFYPDERTYSWYSHQGNGYRYDHCYVHETLLPVLEDCFYLDAWREEKLSDHSPQVLRFKSQ